MSVNLKKHHESMVKAWKDVLDDKTETNWALFGYEGPSNDLRLVGFGDGGLEELAEELNSSQIMYAFLRVSDPQTSLNKCVLINWQGEGAPVVRKGTCANHIRDVERLLHGAHATLNARTEEDVEEARVMKVISTGSRYNFKGPRGAEEQRGPIGSTYQRVIPGREINTAERDIFWQKEEQEEKARMTAETKRKQEENIKLEQERIKKEQLAAQLREKQVTEREAAISEAQKVEKIRVVQIAQGEQDMTPSPPSVTADELRRQRNQEARELIGQRSIANSRALFEGGVQFNKSNLAPVKPVRNSVAQRVNVLTQESNASSNSENKTLPENHKTEKLDMSENNNKNEKEIEREEKVEEIVAIVDNNILQQSKQEQHVVVSETQHNTANVDLNNYNEEANYMVENSDFDQEQNGEQFSTIKRSPHSKSIESNLAQSAEPASATPKLVEPEKLNYGDDTEQNDDYSIYQDMTEPGLQARALYDYQAADESEITFDPGDLITHIDCIDEGWWQGLGPDGTFGLFPANYVELLQ